MKLDYLDIPSREEFAEFSKSRCISKALSTTKYDNARLDHLYMDEGVTTLEVFDNESRLVLNVNSNMGYINHDQFLSNTIYAKSDECIIFLGCFWNCWGHFFTDGFSKVWYLLTEEYKRKYKGKYKLAISFINNTIQQCPKPLLELYKLLDIDQDDLIVISEPTKFREIIVPDNALFFHNGSRHFTKEYTEVINSIVSAVQPIKDKKYEKIYLSRTHFVKGNADFGERSLETVFKQLGYTIVHPQEYSVKEQISIFKTAKSFVSTTGSLGHNSVFCNPGTEVILLRKCFAIFDYQLVINEARNLNVTYVDTHLTCFVNEAPNNGPFFLYRNTNFCRFIKDRFNKIVSEDFSTQKYMRYARICMMRNDMKYRVNAPEYYFKKLQEELKNDSWKRKCFQRITNLLPRGISNKVKSIYFKTTR